MDFDKTPEESRRDASNLEDEAAGIARPGLVASAPGERPHNEPFRDIMARNLERRAFLKGAAATIPVLMAGPSFLMPSEARAALPDGLSFTPIAPSSVDDVVVPDHYLYDVLIRWGDPLFNGAPAFDLGNQTAAAQRQQFGYNCDFLGYFPLKGDDRALLCVNHEYTTGPDMIPGYAPGTVREQADVEIAAHGGTVVEIKRTPSGWTYIQGSPFNRRITGDTPMKITGPAAGDPLMTTSADPTGRNVLGMLNNCAGGKTPWGTWLTCEENFNQYFANNSSVADPDIKAAHARYGLPNGASSRQWENFYDRFDLSKEPNEPFRFGWVIEIDPYDPDFVPRKRTALGRCKHEGATTALSKSGKVVVYSGDDERFDYLYKFVSSRKFNRLNRKANFDLLDNGTLYVARLHDDGTGEWIPLTMSNPVLAAQFSSQAEILVKTRLAADAVGATAMDRPEDVEPNPVNGKVYMVMTNNSARKTVVADAGSATANPRVPNFNGHILEITENRNDHGAKTFRWEIFILCGNPEINLLTDPASIVPGLASNATFFAGYADATKLGKIASPDNVTFDRKGNVWIATDGQPSSADIGKPNDGIHAAPTGGPDRGYLRQFLSGPKGCEICGPEFSDDNRTLFCAIQHPGEDGGLPNAVSNWPDRGTCPRPSVVAVRHAEGGRIGQGAPEDND
jgi:secreted PhoX family phosphatase